MICKGFSPPQFWKARLKEIPIPMHQCVFNLFLISASVKPEMLIYFLLRLTLSSLAALPIDANISGSCSSCFRHHLVILSSSLLEKRHWPLTQVSHPFRTRERAAHLKASVLPAVFLNHHILTLLRIEIQRQSAPLSAPVPSYQTWRA